MDTTTPPPDRPAPGAGDPPATGPLLPQAEGPRVSGEQMRDLGRLRRSVHDRHIAGVAGGLARHLDVDPILVRIGLVVLVFFGGSGLLLYAAGWLLVPEEGSADQPLGLDERSRRIALVGAGVLAALSALGDWAGAYWFPWPVVVVALVVLWFLNRRQQRYPGPTYAGPLDPTAPAHAVPPARIPRDPRRRGPVLLWGTLALIAVGIGTLGVIDVAGTAVPDAAYPALAMALTGVMLVVGAFWGRAGGLILVGLLAAGVTLGASASDDWEGATLSYTPVEADEVRDLYDFGGGDLTLDLSGVTDVDGLDGHRLVVEGGVGEVEVVVPAGMDVAVDVSTGVGEATVFGRAAEGFGVQQDGVVDGGDGAPAMTIEVDLGVGQVTVREQ